MTQILEQENFLSPARCSYIIDKFGTQLNELKVLEGSDSEGRINTEYRIGSGLWISETNDPIIKHIRSKISLISQMPIENQELPHLIRYDIGGKYAPHHDYFFPNSETFTQNCVLRGGQRVYTALVYLNEEYTGGGTDFPELNYMVSPSVGKLAMWRNLTEDFVPNSDTLHAGLPVESGTKWILTVWIRERTFT